MAIDKGAGTAQGTAPIELFVSYSHRDEALRNELEKHLKLLMYEGLIHLWHDRQIGAGQDFAKEISASLNRARIILLLVSPDFMASEYCYGNEMRRAMEHHRLGTARVIPIILRPVDWENAPFGKLEALPTDGKPVTNWANLDDALLNVARGIRLALVTLTVPGSPKLEGGNRRIRRSKSHEDDQDSGASTPFRKYPPGGHIPIDAGYYISRAADDQMRECFSQLPFSALVYGPVQCGKSSLLARLEHAAREAGVHTAWFDPILPSGQTVDQFENTADWNVQVARALSDVLQSQWNLSPPKSSLDSIPRVVTWLQTELKATASKPRLLILDDLSALGSFGLADWIANFARALHNQRALGMAQISLAVGLTAPYQPYSIPVGIRISSVINWFPRVILDWLREEDVMNLQVIFHSRPAKGSRLFNLFRGQPYLTHAGVANPDFFEIVNEWNKQPTESTERQLKESRPYRSHLSAIKRAIFSQLPVPNHKMLALLTKLVRGKSIASDDCAERLLMEELRLIQRNGELALDIYRPLIEDLMDR